MKNFALIGAAGYIAPRHLKAIYETKNNLIAALDKHDNVGVLDSFFPDAKFFTETELFDRHLEKVKNQNPIERARSSDVAPRSRYNCSLSTAKKLLKNWLAIKSIK